MSNVTKEQTHEMSIWELLGLFLKNWIPVCIIIVLLLSAGIVYSFAIQEQGTITYRTDALVIYDDWDYYPPNISHTYVKSLQSHITEKTGGNYLSSVTLADTRPTDGKNEYYLKLSYASSVSRSEAEAIVQHIVDWHNSMIDNEVARIILYNEESLSTLYLEYEKAEQDYYSFLGKDSATSTDSMATQSTLEANKYISYELWKAKKIELHSLNGDLPDASNYYIDNFSVASSTTYTWKSNLVLSLIAGFVLAVLYVLLKESYKHYSAAKKTDAN